MTINERPGLQDEDLDVRRIEKIVGSSAALEEVLGLVKRVAATNSTALILGETGTGKELIAHAIHSISPRYGRPFVRRLRIGFRLANPGIR